jgi:hypothetical protein
VKRAEEPERRRYPRFPHVLDVQAQECPPVDYTGLAKPPIPARVQNVSKGGVCLLSRTKIPRSSLLRCEITIAEVPVAVPTLVRVRWTRKQDMEVESYLCGLQFFL